MSLTLLLLVLTLAFVFVSRAFGKVKVRQKLHRVAATKITCVNGPLLRTRITCYVMHQARTLSTKMNNERADGHCYSFAWN